MTRAHAALALLAAAALVVATPAFGYSYYSYASTPSYGSYGSTETEGSYSETESPSYGDTESPAYYSPTTTPSDQSGTMPAPTFDRELFGGFGTTTGTFTLTGAALPRSTFSGSGDDDTTAYGAYLVYVAFLDNEASKFVTGSLTCETQTGDLSVDGTVIGTVFNLAGGTTEDTADIEVSIDAAGVGQTDVKAINCPTDAAKARVAALATAQGVSITIASSAVTDYTLQLIDLSNVSEDNLPEDAGFATSVENYALEDATFTTISDSATAAGKTFAAYFGDTICDTYHTKIVASVPQATRSMFACNVSAARRRRNLLVSNQQNQMSIAGGAALARALQTALNAAGGDASMLNSIAAALGVDAAALGRVFTPGTLKCKTSQKVDCVWSSGSYGICEYDTSFTSAVFPDGMCRKAKSTTITTNAGLCAAVQCPSCDDSTVTCSSTTDGYIEKTSTGCSTNGNTCTAVAGEPVIAVRGSGDDGLSGGAIAGIVIGSVAGVGLIGAGAFFGYQYRMKKQNIGPGYMATGDAGTAGVASGGASYSAVQVAQPAAEGVEYTSIMRTRVP